MNVSSEIIERESNEMVVLFVKVLLIAIISVFISISIQPFVRIAVYHNFSIEEWFYRIRSDLVFLIPRIVGGLSIVSVVCAVVARITKERMKYLVSAIFYVLPTWISIAATNRSFDFIWKPIGISYAGTTFAHLITSLTIPALLHFLNYKPAPNMYSFRRENTLAVALKCIKQLALGIAMALVFLAIIMSSMYTGQRAAYFVVFVFGRCFEFSHWFPVFSLAVYLTVSANFTSRREFTLAAILACVGYPLSRLLFSAFNSGSFQWADISKDWPQNLEILPSSLVLTVWTYWMFRNLPPARDDTAPGSQIALKEPA
jgi:hypothetical protein